MVAVVTVAAAAAIAVAVVVDMAVAVDMAASRSAFRSDLLSRVWCGRFRVFMF